MLEVLQKPNQPREDQNLLVYRSSAGSGKTYTLVKTYLILLFQSPVLARDNGDCQKQIEKATYYLDNIESPEREISAHYFMANCYYADGKNNEALFHYDFITQKPNNNYYTEALKYAGEITFEAHDYKNALGYFSTLEDVSMDQEDLALAVKGQFYCFHYLNNPLSTIKYAQKTLLLSDLSNKLKEESYLFLGQEDLVDFLIEPCHNSQNIPY